MSPLVSLGQYGCVESPETWAEDEGLSLSVIEVVLLLFSHTVAIDWASRGQYWLAACHVVIAALMAAFLIARATREYRDLAIDDLMFRSIDLLLQFYSLERVSGAMTITLHGVPIFMEIQPQARGPEDFVTSDHVPMLLELARHGDEATFRDLARSLGVKAEHLDAMWTGTRARVERQDAKGVGA